MIDICSQTDSIQMKDLQVINQWLFSWALGIMHHAANSNQAWRGQRKKEGLMPINTAGRQWGTMINDCVQTRVHVFNTLLRTANEYGKKINRKDRRLLTLKTHWVWICQKWSSYLSVFGIVTKNLLASPSIYAHVSGANLLLVEGWRHL